MPRWVGPVFAGLGLLTLPWIAYLAFTLPERQIAGHYRMAWVGFDVMLVAALLRTGYLAWRGRGDVSVPAAITASLLGVDAWFDVLTSTGAEDVATAIGLAVFVELPLAALCLWLARHAELVRQRQLTFLRRRARGGRDSPRPVAQPPQRRSDGGEPSP